jgi:hypothetical protein
VHISDTHGHHDSIHLPQGDVLIHSGGFSSRCGNRKEIENFTAWLKTLSYQFIIIIAGNHEWTFELAKEKYFKGRLAKFKDEHFGIGYDQGDSHRDIKEILTMADPKKIIYLENSSVELFGYKIFGSPYCKIWASQAFSLKDEKLADIWG